MYGLVGSSLSYLFPAVIELHSIQVAKYTVSQFSSVVGRAAGNYAVFRGTEM